MLNSFLILLSFATALADPPSRSIDHAISSSLSVGTKAVANSKSVVDMVSTTKGMLPPRMTSTQRDAITSPPTGLVIYNTTTAKLNQFNGTAWVDVGSSNGTSGVNFVSLGSDFTVTQSTSSDFELSVGNWTTYSSGTTTPATLTGGSATQLTLSRTTTAAEVLSGTASGKIVKAAANAQGQGSSVVGYVPVGWRGQDVTIAFPFKVVSGTLVSGDVKVFIEDVTNSRIITPDNNGVNGTGTILAKFQVPSTCTQMRLGVHFASTSTAALTYSLDDVVVGPLNTPIGLAGSNWQSYTPTFTGFGTATGIDFKWRQVAQNIEVEGQFLMGTTTGVEARVSLPYTIDSGVTDNTIAGIYWDDATPYHVVAKGSDTYVTFANSTSGSSITRLLGTQIGSSGQIITMRFSTRIAGWDAGVISSESRVFKISSYLANGTRVTGSPPTERGQYRSYRRDASAFTLSETSADPSTSPTVADGIKIWATGNGAGYTTQDSANNPSVYEIFVGKNKTVSLLAFSGTGRTGQISTDYTYVSNTTVIGLQKSYDPTTGIFTVWNAIQSSAVNDTKIGYNASGTSYTSAYFDLEVSDNPLPVQSKPTPNIKKASFGTGNRTTVCSASPCDVYGDDTSWISSFVRNSGGDYTVNFATGTFSSNPECLILPYSSSNRCPGGAGAAPSTTSWNWNVTNCAGGLSDISGTIWCFGPL